MARDQHAELIHAAHDLVTQAARRRLHLPLQETGLVGDVRDAGRMREHVKDRDGVPRGRRVRPMLLDRIFERELAALREQQDRSRRELLRDRAQAKLRGRRVRHVPFEVREAVALAQDDLVAARDEHGAHEAPVGDAGADHGVHARGVLRAGERGQQQKRERRSAQGEGDGTGRRCHC